MRTETTEDKRKFCVLYEKYRYLFQKTAMDILHDSQLAEDATQEAYLKIARNMNEIGDVDSRRTKRYIISIVQNTAIDILRKRNRQRTNEVFEAEVGEEGLPISCMETNTDNAVLNILKKLPDTYRDIFLLKYSVGMENREIARMCGIKEGTVRQRIARGKVLIISELQKLEDDRYGAYTSNR